MTQQEARARSLQEAVREAEAKKRTLEDLADTLRDECAKLRAANQVIFLNILFVLKILLDLHLFSIYS